MNEEEIPTILLYLFGIIMTVGLVLDVVFLVRLGSKRRRSDSMDKFGEECRWSVSEGLRLFVVLAVFHAILYLALLFLNKAGLLAEDAMTGVAFGGHILLFHGVIIAYSAVALRRKGGSWSDMLGLAQNARLKHVLHGIVYYMAAMPSVLLAGWIYDFFLTDIGYAVDPDDVQDVVRLFLDPMVSQWLKFGAAIVGITFVPAAEEILFRSIALRLLAKRTSRFWAALLVSACFSVMHMHIPSAVPLFVFSLALCWGYMHTGSLIVPIVMHAAFNGVAICSSMLRSTVS